MMEDILIPIIDFYCSDETIYKGVQDETKYPYLVYHSYNESKFKRYVWLLLKKINHHLAHRYYPYRFDSRDVLAYPYYLGANVKNVFWCPDFQEKYMPECFSAGDLKSRSNMMKYVGDNQVPIVFSSETCLSDFKRFYPNLNNTTFVLKFAVIHPKYDDLEPKALLEKYNISQPYFLCSNQFWKHKNHLFLFNSFRKAVDSGLDAYLICTGNMSDYRNPDYIHEIEQFLSAHNKDNRIRLLGMIDRKEQLCLMKHAYSVIQPSLFEGWNTTVEDCKAMNQHVFLSDIPVHREQMSRNVCFFNPHNESDLVEKLLTVKPTSDDYDYHEDILRFGRGFVELINHLD